MSVALRKIRRMGLRSTDKTKTARSEAQILRAYAELLATRSYDDVPLKDVAEAAGVGQATLYARFDTKAVLTAELFRPLLPPAPEVHRDNMDLAAFRCSDLRRYLLDLGSVCATPENRRIARAYLRAYGNEVLAAAQPDPRVANCITVADGIVNAIVRSDPSASAALLQVPKIGERWSIDVLLVSLSVSPDRVRPVCTSLLSIYLPPTGAE